MNDAYKKKLEGLQRGAGMAPKAKQPMFNPQSFETTPEEQEAYARAMEQLMMNSPTRGQVQPNAQDLMMKEADEQSQLDELFGEEPPVQKNRFNKLFGK